MSMRLSHLAVSSGGTTLVDVENLHFERGRAVTIVGESGSGKSLLAHAIMGTLPDSLTVRGSLAVDRTTYDLAERANRQALWGTVMSLLPQEPVLSLDPTMRVQEQVAEGARSFASDKGAAHTSARALLGSLGLGHVARAYPHTLSGGMAQRAAFAAATIGNARVLIADEPSKGLDETARGELASLLKRHLEAGGILLTITHDLGLARDLAGTVLVMKDAHVVEQGLAGRVLAEPGHPYTRRLLAAEPANWAYSWANSGTAAGPAGQPLITGEGLSKSYGGQRLFSDLTVTLGQGERIALSGPSGSGKTTLGNILLRLLPPDSGHVSHADVLDGGRLQKLYQDPTLAFARRTALKDSFGDVMKRHRLDRERLDELMALLRLASGLLERMPGQVSGGELQRLAIIRAMLLRPALVFADEPTSRLDLITQQETMSCLMDQVDSQGSALMLVTHDKSLGDAVAHRSIPLGAGDGQARGREFETASAT
jgi:peptide/nickel transport system ATP-binding protein